MIRNRNQDLRIYRGRLLRRRTPTRSAPMNSSRSKVVRRVQLPPRKTHRVNSCLWLHIPERPGFPSTTGLARLRVVCPSSDGGDHGDDCFATHPRPGGFARSGPVSRFRDEKGKKKKRGRCAPSQETSHDDRAWPNPPDDRSTQKAIPKPEPFAVPSAPEKTLDLSPCLWILHPEETERRFFLPIPQEEPDTQTIIIILSNRLN